MKPEELNNSQDSQNAPMQAAAQAEVGIQQDPSLTSQPQSVQSQINQVQSSPQAVPVSAAMPTVADKKSKKPMLIGGIIAFISILLAVAAALYVFVFSAAAQANKASNDFMKAVTTGDTTTLLEKNSDGTEANNTFLETTSELLRGDYALIEKDAENGTYYFLYEVSTDPIRYARTIVENDEEGWSVTSIVHGENKLRLIPGDVEDGQTPSEVTSEPVQAPEPTAATPSPQGCLVNDDYRWLSYNDAVPSVNYVTTETDGFLPIYEAVTFFEPDSIKQASTDEYDYWAEFGTKNSNKNWEFVLKGGVWLNSASTAADPAAIKLANERANEVKRQLVSRGVPEGKITIANPTEHSEEYQPGFEAEIFRTTALFVDNGCVTYPSTVTDRVFN